MTYTDVHFCFAVWILVAPYIATGAIAPFVGNLSDLMGRRAIVLGSCVLIVVGYILSGAAPNFSCFLGGATITGAAIGIQILTVIAAASELVPMHKRGQSRPQSTVEFVTEHY